jgi:glycosyltransferase involved in cell wall biosynthesis
MTLAESLACGTPVICSKLGAMEEIINDSRTGMHFTPGDSEDLARKINWAFVHPSDIATMGQAARREYEARYTSERAFTQLMTIYEETVATYA